MISTNTSMEEPNATARKRTDTFSFKASRSTGQIKMAQDQQVGMVRNLSREIKSFTPERFGKSIDSGTTRHGTSLMFPCLCVAVMVSTICAQFVITDPQINAWLSRVSYVAIPCAIWYYIKRLPFVRRITSRFSFFCSAADYLQKADEQMRAGNVLSAEAYLEKACDKSKQREKHLLVLVTAELAAVKAQLGKTHSAFELAQVALTLSDANYEARPTDSNGLSLAKSLACAARVCDTAGQLRESHDYWRRSVEMYVLMESPPADGLISSLLGYATACAKENKLSDALLYMEKAEELINTMFAENENMIYALVVAKSVLQISQSDLRLLASEELPRAIEMAERSGDVRKSGRLHALSAKLESNIGSYAKAREHYELARKAYVAVNPSNSHEHAEFLQDYAYFLRVVGDQQSYDEAKQAARKMLTILQDISYAHKGMTAAVDVKAQEAVLVKPARYPWAWSVITFAQGCLLWDFGLRVAPGRMWFFFVMSLVVLGIKLWSKFSPPSRHELGDGTRLALVTCVPFARHILPELSAMSKNRLVALGIISGALIFSINFLLVKPGTVPQGLLQHEYFMLACAEVDKDELVNAQLAFDKAIEMSPLTDDGKRAALFKHLLLPKIMPDTLALNLNKQALSSFEGGDTETAAREWRKCLALFPNFETPQLHLAEMSFAAKHQDEAEKILLNVLDKNPDNFKALMLMMRAKSADNEERGRYAKRIATLVGGETDFSTLRIR